MPTPKQEGVDTMQLSMPMGESDVWSCKQCGSTDRPDLNCSETSDLSNRTVSTGHTNAKRT